MLTFDRYVNSPVGNFATPSTCLENVHIDIIVMLYSENSRKCLMCTDRFSHLPEVFSMLDQEAITLAWVFTKDRFADSERRFKSQPIEANSNRSQPFNRFGALALNVNHPSWNVMVQRLHTHLKAANWCFEGNNCSRILPTHTQQLLSSVNFYACLESYS